MSMFYEADPYFLNFERQMLLLSYIPRDGPHARLLSPVISFVALEMLSLASLPDLVNLVT